MLHCCCSTTYEEKTLIVLKASFFIFKKRENATSLTIERFIVIPWSNIISSIHTRVRIAVTKKEKANVGNILLCFSSILFDYEIKINDGIFNRTCNFHSLSLVFSRNDWMFYIFVQWKWHVSRCKYNSCIFNSYINKCISYISDRFIPKAVWIYWCTSQKYK